MPADASDDRWDVLGQRFVDVHYSSLRGRVRTEVLNAHLREHLAPPPLTVVDVGGGAGNQSIPLARLGYEVTILDPSPAMLDRARQHLASERPELQERVRLVEATGEEAPEALQGEAFGAVLCHGVIMYVEDPRPLVDSLCALAGPSGLVSIVAKNVDVLAVRPALEGDWGAALAAFDSDRQVNGLGVDTRADSIADLSTMVAERGVEPIGWYGVRLFTDGWAREDLDGDDEALAVQVELEASRRDPYRQLSRLFHLVGRRV